jgi:Uri superfamily endonuclease
MCATYLLQIEVDRNLKTQVGKLGNLYFRKGYYLYVGSAKRGLEARIKRHLRKDKKIFWHIDYLLQKKGVRISQVWVGTQKECWIAKRLAREGFEVKEGFGSSDCHCLSHLFYSPQKESFQELTAREMKVVSVYEAEAKKVSPLSSEETLRRRGECSHE